MKLTITPLNIRMSSCSELTEFLHRAYASCKANYRMEHAPGWVLIRIREIPMYTMVYNSLRRLGYETWFDR